MIKKFHPELFQGNKKKHRYFEGWYFKHVSADKDNVYAFIPGISLSEDSHAFIQVMDGISGRSQYLRYPLSSFYADTKPFKLQVGDSEFSLDGASINIHDEKIDAHGRIEYQHMMRLPRTIFRPGIMGPYTFVPFMECKHGVVSVNHQLSGSISIDGKKIDFSSGKGYIEKDWGTSFPETWIWLQSNHFAETDASFMLSIAKIPWLGRFFMGFLGFFHLNAQTHLLATYNGSSVRKLKQLGPGEFTVLIESPSGTLEVQGAQLIQSDLKAPVSGNMNRLIKESSDAAMTLKFTGSSGDELFSGRGERAGLEIIDTIFDYFK